ncbi:MAG: hypothetical protein OXF23_01190 [Candidatus Dadabacteria bacterium]|nr:hypothetical protein [Candidatus Dadabacteria bacterium]
MKTGLLLATCIALFFTGGIANAFSTCSMNMDMSSVEMQMDDNMDMPCHKTEDSENQSSEQCEDCNCLHCIQMNALPVQKSQNHYGKVTVETPFGKLPPSYQSEIPFHPPKHLC